MDPLRCFRVYYTLGRQNVLRLYHRVRPEILQGSELASVLAAEYRNNGKRD